MIEHILLLVLVLVQGYTAYRVTPLCWPAALPPEQPATPPTARPQRCTVLKNGQRHHTCRIGSRDYHDALATPGLSIRHADGSIDEGKQ